MDALCPIYKEYCLDKVSLVEISFPFIQTFPEPIEVIDDSSLSVVVLPEPFDPSKQVAEPEESVKDKLLNTFCK